MTSVIPKILTISYMGASFLVGLAALNLSPSRRTLPLFLLVIFALSAFRRLKTVSPTPECGQLLGLFVLIWLAHISSVVYIEKYVITKRDDDRWQWVNAYKMLFNARWIHTSRPAPDVCHTVRKDDAVPGIEGTPKDTERQTKTQSIRSDEIKQIQSDYLKYFRRRNATQMDAVEPSRRQKFFFRRAFSLLAIYTAGQVYYILFLPHPTLFKQLAYSDFSPTQQVFFRRLLSKTITRREIIIRAWTVFHFIFCNWTFIRGAHDILSVFFVSILRVDDPEDWPRLFGSITNTYTLQGFWGGFWHSLVYRAYTSWAKLVSQRVFRMERNGMIGKVAVNFLVFLFSGVTHALVSWQLGNQCGVWEELVWFCSCFLAMMVERVVQQAVKHLLAEKEDSRGYLVIRKGVGFLWVFTFFFWSLPKVHYPQHYCGMRG